MRNFLIVFLPLFLFHCKSRKEIDASWGRNRNIAGKLIDKTVVYTFFVDSKNTLPFSGFDVASTKDSLQRVFDWVGNQATIHGQNLEIVPMYYQKGSQNTVKKNFPFKTINDAIGDEKENVFKLKKLKSWANGIARMAAKDIQLP